jgi:predicted kinase
VFESGERRSPPFTIFFISPANLAGERGALLFRPTASFPLAEQLRSREGAPLGDVYSFVSGLYFRGKRAYAEAFGKAPAGLSAGLVISPAEGLRFLYEPVTLERLRGWAEVDIDEHNRAFTEPLIEHAAALDRALGAHARFVLLGSVATDKYVVPLGRVFGRRLLFPPDFLGRGDMSRGSLLLRAARAGVELSYAPIEGSERRGPRPPAIARRSAIADAAGAGPELVILVGLPGAGKSTFYRERFAASHVHVSRDLLRRARQPERRQEELLRAALAERRSVVVDNTNVSIKDRAALIAIGRAHGARISVYSFDCTARECVARNALREGAARIPTIGIFAAQKRLVRPDYAEGFDALYLVRPTPDLHFDVVPVASAAESPSR